MLLRRDLLALVALGSVVWPHGSPHLPEPVLFSLSKKYTSDLPDMFFDIWVSPANPVIRGVQAHWPGQKKFCDGCHI